MAQNQNDIACPSNVWTQITNGDVTKITFQVLTKDVGVRFSVGEVQPLDSDRGITYVANEGVEMKLLSEMVTLVGANRVWVKPTSVSSALVYVDHA